MQFAIYPVVLPFSPQADDARGAAPSISIQAVASAPRSAVAVAQAFAHTFCIVRYGHQPERIHLERAQVGAPGTPFHSPYAYIVGKTNHIGVLPLPPRLDRAAAAEFKQRLIGYQAGAATAVLIDAALLAFLDSSALATLAGESRQLPIHLFRPNQPIGKVLEIVGMDRVLNIHGTLAQALKSLCPSRP